MKKLLAAAGPLVVLSLLGCDNAASPDRLIAPPSSASLDQKNDDHEKQTVEGRGHYLLSGLYDVTFSFKAKLSSDGSAKGQFTQSTTLDNGTVDISATVTCATIDAVNHRAWIGGVVTKNRSTSPDYIDPITAPGQDVWFRVVDYGEGGGTLQPDRSTFLGFAGAIPTSAAYCAAAAWAAGDARTHPVTSGDIQVGDKHEQED
jgi:uncharacterized lipoprotein NlpE involved in copper resistance